jgi:hypothetical protein
MVLTKQLFQAMTWREDYEKHKELVDNYFGYESISCNALDWICDTANKWWELNDSHLRIYWHMGEIMPASHRQRQLSTWDILY